MATLRLIRPRMSPVASVDGVPRLVPVTSFSIPTSHSYFTDGKERERQSKIGSCFTVSARQLRAQKERQRTEPFLGSE